MVLFWLYEILLGLLDSPVWFGDVMFRTICVDDVDCISFSIANYQPDNEANYEEAYSSNNNKHQRCLSWKWFSDDRNRTRGISCKQRTCVVRCLCTSQVGLSRIRVFALRTHHACAAPRLIPLASLCNCDVERSVKIIAETYPVTPPPSYRVVARQKSKDWVHPDKAEPF